MYQILDQIEMIRVGRTAQGSAFFTDAMKSTVETLEVGQGFVIPWMPEYKKVNQVYNHRKYLKTWSKEAGVTLVVGETENGVGIKRVA